MWKTYPQKSACCRDSCKSCKRKKICFLELTNCTNESLTNNKFADILRFSDRTPVFKEFDPSDKANYRPVSILPLASKAFENSSACSLW